MGGPSIESSGGKSPAGSTASIIGYSNVSVAK